MRFEIILFLIAGFIIANIYTDGKYMKLVYSGKKYYKMAAVAFGALMLYVLLKKNPNRAKDIVSASNEYVKYLPIDKNISNMISPILDFTSKQDYYNDSFGGGGGGGGSLDGNTFNRPIVNMNREERSNQIMMNSGRQANKRSVSESKKKLVASRQSWKCSGCGEMLKATYEIDHIKRLEYGGDNHIDNLTALCRGCHGEKTLMENL